MSYKFETKEIVGVIRKSRQEQFIASIVQVDGVPMVDIRIYYLNQKGELKHTKKGFSMNLNTLTSVILLLADARERLIKATKIASKNEP